MVHPSRRTTSPAPLWVSHPFLCHNPLSQESGEGDTQEQKAVNTVCKTAVYGQTDLQTPAHRTPPARRVQLCHPDVTKVCGIMRDKKRAQGFARPLMSTAIHHHHDFKHN